VPRVVLYIPVSRSFAVLPPFRCLALGVSTARTGVPEGLLHDGQLF